MKTVLLFFCAALCAQAPLFAQTAQTLPHHFSGAGGGFQAAANTNKASGWTTYCLPVSDKIWGCAATDFNAGTTSARADVDVLVYNYKNACYVLSKSGAGAASNLANLGASFDFGGIVACQVSGIFKRAPKDYLAVFSGSWQKNNVNELFGPNFNLRSFGAQTVWRFGVGKAW
jgi:hypothetical protein